jgi:hypothetical protein
VTTVQASGVATRFLEALARRDFDALGETFAPDARLRGLVPSRLRDEEGRDAIAARFRFWNEGGDWEVLEYEQAEMTDVVRLRWRISSTDPDDGPSIYEQVAYAQVGENGIEWMNLVCSGHRSTD